METPIDVTRMARGFGAAARCSGERISERVRHAFRNPALWGAIVLICAVIAPGTVQAQGDAQTGVSEVVLHSFAGPVHGAFPYAGLIRDSAGNLYGTTYQGGTGNVGVVYTVSARGRQTVLYNFTGGSDGGYPQAGVVLDSAGNLYGTTGSDGGPAGAGVVYKLDPSGNETVLHSFTGGSDGRGPVAGVALDSAGNIYGTTPAGGSAGWGVVYKLDTSGNEAVLHNFTGGSDGGAPYAGVHLDSAGNIYGTTAQGGSAGWGVVYRLDPSGNEAVLYNFTGGSNGGYPYAGVLLDSAGNIYGTTLDGGSAGWGVVYKLDPSGNETVLHSFTGGSDGGDAYTGVVLDSAGNLYGTTYYGGTAGFGVVYKLDPSGNETVLHNFAGGTDGARPWSGVVLDRTGNLYGTTHQGGTSASGVVFKLDASGDETLLYTFPQSPEGALPFGAVARDSAGNLYGTTYYGGSAGYGVVFKLGPLGNETVLHNFTGGADGGYPYTGVILDSAGNLYGTAQSGGTAGEGVIYKLDPLGNETVLYNFAYGSGASPAAGVVFDSAGNLYGTAASGGSEYGGVVYKLDPSGNEAVLHNFAWGTADGADPLAGVVLDSAGNLYGTTPYGGTADAGVVYKLDPGGNESLLHTFTGGSDGAFPYAGVVLDAAGNVYGTALNGGTAGAGVVYKLDPSGSETVLYNFTWGSDGGGPFAGVVFDSAGSLYGTTYGGGSAGVGAVYRLDPSGNETVLHSFTGGSDGSNPQAGVTLDSAGNLYGTTTYGGNGSGGVVYKIRGAVPRK